MTQISQNIEKEIYGKIFENFLFRKMKKKFVENLIKIYENVNKKIIRSLRNEYIKNDVFTKYHTVANNKNLISDYRKMTIIDLAKKYKLPPVTLFKIIEKTEKLITNYDKEQYKLAIENDIFSITDHTKQLKYSIAFEKKIENVLNKKNIKFTTQDELVEAQTKQYGRAISTPDFLLNSDLYIDYVKINWIDAKNFYGACTPFINYKIKKQIKKYIANYGSGCIIFKLDACSELMFKGVLVLSYEKFNNLQ